MSTKAVWLCVCGFICFRRSAYAHVNGTKNKESNCKLCSAFGLIKDVYISVSQLCHGINASYRNVIIQNSHSFYCVLYSLPNQTFAIQYQCQWIFINSWHTYTVHFGIHLPNIVHKNIKCSHMAWSIGEFT